jgi:hypothetical protein
MSRSFRKTKIFGNTTSPSEKKGKRITNKKFRRHNKILLNKGKEENFWNKHDEANNVWAMEKDGKKYQKDIDPKYMRK